MSVDGGKTCTPIIDKMKSADRGITRANVPYIVDTKTFLWASEATATPTASSVPPTEGADLQPR